MWIGLNGSTGQCTGQWELSLLLRAPEILNGKALQAFCLIDFLIMANTKLSHGQQTRDLSASNPNTDHRQPRIWVLLSSANNIFPSRKLLTTIKSESSRPFLSRRPGTGLLSPPDYWISNSRSSSSHLHPPSSPAFP